MYNCVILCVCVFFLLHSEHVTRAYRLSPIISNTERVILSLQSTAEIFNHLVQTAL